MSDNNDILAEEIYEYYQNVPEEEKAEVKKPAPVSAQKKPVQQKKIRKFSDFFDKLAKNMQENKGLYITLITLAAEIIIMCGGITGILIPKNEEKVANRLEELKNANDIYIQAFQENERLSKRVEELYDQRTQIGEELGGITDYEAVRDQAKADIKDVSAQLEVVKNKIEQKQSELDGLRGKIENMGGEVTLTPGMYMVGEHIAEGEYSVKGEGSLLVSGADSKLKINTRLTNGSAYTCSLSRGDIIKLEARAEFDPA